MPVVVAGPQPRTAPVECIVASVIDDVVSTGQVGDGTALLLPVESVLGIRTGTRGPDAV